MPPPNPPLPVLDHRDAVDAALQQRINALMEEAESQQAQPRRRDLREQARDLERRVNAFIAAVDAAEPEGGQPRPAYDEAVVLVGKLRTVVTDERSYADTPFYWQALASQPERALHGAQLLAELRSPQPPG